MTRIESKARPDVVTSSVVPYDLRVGVTGHRSIADETAVAAAVRQLMQRVAQTLERSNAVPVRWTLISPIASGADQIVAEVLLDHPGVALEVLLPFAEEAYRASLDNPGDRARFDTLRRQAARTHRLTASGESSRDFAYCHLGHQLVDSCELLIAIWNGQPAAGPGGTASVVAYALEHDRTVLWIEPEQLARGARIIRSIRKLSAGSLEIDSTDLDSAAERISRGHSQQVAFFADDAVAAGVIACETEKESQRLNEIARRSGLSPEDIAPLTTVLPHYVRADLLARRQQKRHVRATGAVMFLAASAVSVAVAQVLFFPQLVQIIAVELLAMTAALALWNRGKRESWHAKWLESRYLAERLRIAMFASLIERAPGISQDGGLPFYPGPQHWLRGVVDELAQRADSLRRAISPVRYRAFLQSAWLGEQHAFHERTSRSVRRRAHRRHLLGYVLFAVTFIMATLHFLHIPHAPANAQPGLRRIDLWITYLALILPVWAGSIHAVTMQFELERVGERSRRMSSALAASLRRMECTQTPADVMRTAREAARLMTMEAHEWWILLSFQNARLHV